MYFLVLYIAFWSGFWLYNDYKYTDCRAARKAYIQQIDVCLAQKRVTMDCVDKVVELGKEETRTCK